MSRLLATLALAMVGCAVPLQLARGKCPGLTSRRIDAGTALATMTAGMLISPSTLRPFDDRRSNYKAGAIMIFGALSTLMIDIELTSQSGCR